MVALNKNTKLAVVGLGYVGLPLALAFGRHFPTIGFDLSKEKINSYTNKIDPNKEVGLSEFQNSKFIEFTSEPGRFSEAKIIIVCVPTPVDSSKSPDPSFLISACQLIGKNMKKGTIVVFESTVYPGLTEDICVPELETTSNLIWKKDFFIGYSPERINPGDKKRSLTEIVKVVAGDMPKTTNILVKLYGKIIEAGIHKATSIKVAEAAKVIENTQRDLNIALMNELAIIFDRLEINTSDVLEAANTKWNFIDFKPGLVGGHCIGVDPYYLTHKAESVGYSPQVILAGRRINDGIPNFIAQKTLALLNQNNKHDGEKLIGVLGATFKENCSDVRNSKAIELINCLEEFGCVVQVCDPVANTDELNQFLTSSVVTLGDLYNLNCIVVAVNHQIFSELKAPELCSLLKPGGVIIDVKSTFPENYFSAFDVTHWRY